MQQSGREYIMYHGTTTWAAESILASGFRQSANGMLGHGVYLCRYLDKARRYPFGCPESKKVVIKVGVDVGKMIAITCRGHPLRKSWHSRGYDMAWVPPRCLVLRSCWEDICVWDPQQISIIEVIQPRPVTLYSGSSARGNIDADSMQGAEGDFELSYWATRLGESAPESDKVHVMYHGTTRWAAQAILASGFRQSADGMLGRGIYLSRDLEKASRYPTWCHESEKVVIRVEVNVGEPIIINCQHHPLQKSWHSQGYDTAWVPPGCGMVRSGLEEMCVWDPRRIRIIDVIKP